MEFWEFLLQKEGDRSWLPLESANVEILEGRYRVVARSSRPNTPLEIKVTQQDFDEMPPVRRIQKRSGKTNPQGLVVVMPFTRLQPGDWELRCTGDLMDDMLGNGWSQMVQLQVLSTELDSDWHEELIEPNLTGAERAAFYSEPDIALETDRPTEVAVPPIELPVTPIASSAIPAAESLAEVSQIAAIEPSQPLKSQTLKSQPPEVHEPIAVNSPAARQSLCLVLSQDTWVILRNQSFTLTGTIASLEATDSSPIAGTLHIRLFNPQNSQMLFEQHYPIQAQPLPIAFAYELSLPADSPAYLVLGELALYGMAQPGEQPPVLATQSFNVTTELHELLESIADSFPPPDLALPPQATAPQEAQLAEVDLSFFNISPVTQTLLTFQSSEQNFLPPQLHPTNPAKVRRLDLPSFTANDRVNGDRVNGDRNDIPLEENTEPQEIRLLDAAVVAEIVANINTNIASQGKAEAVNPENHATPAKNYPEALIPEAAIAPPTEEQALPERLDELTGDWDEDWEIATDGTLNWRQVQPKQPASPEDRAFQSLNLQNRFLNRLQTLATDPEISDWLTEPSAIVPSNPIDREIVVDDDEPPQPQVDPILSTQAAKPVPVPQVEIPTGELIAGQPINVVVRLPKSATRIYAKLWIRDRQLRVLIEGPRWLIDFKPDGFGGLKAQTLVTLPLGCMEVQFEAIAIEMTNQSESQRTILCRSVISPELSTSSLEELDA